MNNVKFFLIGLYFGIVLIKAEVISWFRIQEMFHFQSLHMYGIMGLAVMVGAISVVLIRKLGLKSAAGETIDLTPKAFNKVGNITGGILFGFGWALTGACPGPFYALLGAGYWTILVPLIGALLGVICYGVLKPRLPH
jgi:uncharacterized membrane protein YedE/YeeE